jgi:hypothetical protein
MMTWAIVFAVMIAARGVGDDHPGQWLPFWQHACGDERRSACEYLMTTEAIYCRGGSGWACNEAGVLYATLRNSAATAGTANSAATIALFDRGCTLGFDAACRNHASAAAGGRASLRAPATLADYPIVLRGTKGPITDSAAPALLARACHQGWAGTCAPPPGERSAAPGGVDNYTGELETEWRIK